MKTKSHPSSAQPDRAIHVLEFAFTGYPVTDMARAKSFYEDLLGLKRGMVWEESGRAWVEYDVGGHTLALANSAPQWKPSSDGPAIALEVEDFDATVAALRQRGTRFTVEPLDVPTCRLAVILDPDGNSIAIHQRKGSARA
jgi:predicted enzyme related to lactoylglutathione lyase